MVPQLEYQVSLVIDYGNMNIGNAKIFQIKFVFVDERFQVVARSKFALISRTRRK